MLAISDRSIRDWGPFVSEETKAARLADNARTRAAVEGRLAELEATDAASNHP
jgi:hypothetical protein